MTPPRTLQPPPPNDPARYRTPPVHREGDRSCWRDAMPGADHCFLGVEVAPIVDEGLEFLDRTLGR